MEALKHFFEPFLHTVSAYLPRLIPAVLVLLLGVLLATLFRLMVRALIRSGLRFMEKKMTHYRVIISHGREAVLLGLIPRLSYWLLILLSLAIASEALGLPLFSTWLNELIVYIPHVLLAVLILIAGLIGGSFLKDLVIKSAFRMRLPHGDVLGYTAQGVTVIIAAVVAINELGINISFLTDVVSIVLAAFLLGAAIAFGMGSNTSIRNILACYYIRKHIEVGQSVQIDGIKGTVAEISATTVMLNSDQGIVLIPGKHFAEQIAIITRGDQK